MRCEPGGTRCKPCKNGMRCEPDGTRCEPYGRRCEAYGTRGVCHRAHGVSHLGHVGPPWSLKGLFRQPWGPTRLTWGIKGPRGAITWPCGSPRGPVGPLRGAMWLVCQAHGRLRGTAQKRGGIPRSQMHCALPFSRLLCPPSSCEASSPILKMQTLATCITERPDLAIYSINHRWRSVPLIGEYK
jgi:hypothetical protein